MKLLIKRYFIIQSSKPTVLKWIKRYEETGDVKRKLATGRSRITTPQEDAAIVEIAKATPFKTTSLIRGNKAAVSHSARFQWVSYLARICSRRWNGYTVRFNIFGLFNMESENEQALVKFIRPEFSRLMLIFIKFLDS